AAEHERLYHLPSDPGQERDLRHERPEMARELRAGYLTWLGEQHAEMRDWLQAIERDRTYRPDASRLFAGTL
ncbi:MAG TPA: hypothetical protein VHN78_08240, partial [Chloroflexota bacterium]|nr:hypothetical protein [Chloroflexota bacterium]